MMADDIRVHWIPLCIFVIVPATFLISYCIAVGLGDVEAGFPYISDTGTKSPESCIFGQLLNIAAVFAGCFFYVRYRQLEHHLSHHDDQHLRRANVVSLIMGLIAALGISMVGNFQETNVLAVHLLGAMMAFGVGCVYAWVQTFISYRTSPYLISLRICHLRAVLSVVSGVTFVMTFVFASLAMRDFKGADVTKWYPSDGVSAQITHGLAFILDKLAKDRYHGLNPRKWYPSDGGFTYHVVSTASEWIMAASQLIYFLTFAREFRHLRMSVPRVTVMELTNSGLVITDDGDVPIIT